MFDPGQQNYFCLLTTSTSSPTLTSKTLQLSLTHNLYQVLLLNHHIPGNTRACCIKIILGDILPSQTLCYMELND